MALTVTPAVGTADRVVEGWNVVECWRILRRNPAALLVLACIGALVGAAVALPQPRVYESRAAIEIEYPNDSFLDLQTIFPASPRGDAELSVQTQAELLRRDSVVWEAARMLHPAAAPQARSEWLANVQPAVSIVPVHNTRILQIICDAREPAAAADLADAIAESFIQQSTQSARRGAWKLYDSLEEQLRQLRPANKPSTSEKAAAEPFYDVMLRQANRARLASAAYESNVRLVARAHVPDRPSRPNVPLLIAIGAFGGVVGAVGFILLREEGMEMVRAPADVRRMFGSLELGAAPDVTAAGPRFSIRSRKGRSFDAVEWNGWSGGVSEAFHMVLAGMIKNEGCAPRTILVTSALSGEGKTMAVCNLGLALAKLGRKTLLIDGNLRNPTLTTLMAGSHARRDGRMSEDDPLENGIEKTSASGLYLIRRPVVNEGPTRLLPCDRMALLIAMLRREFEYILIDAPACLEDPEARGMARSVDGALMIVRANYARACTVQSALDLLERDGCNVIGVMLNRWRTHRTGNAE